VINSTVFRWLHNDDCLLSNRTYPSDPYLGAYALRYTPIGCGPIYARSLLALNEINHIPIDRKIVSASLTLFYAQHNESKQISFLPKMNLISPSDVLVQRIKSPWSSQTTYMNQPEITRENSTVIPAKSLREGPSVTIDITRLVQDMRMEGQSNYGVQLTLRIESPDQSMIFCSPSHPDISRRPRIELIIE
jgi:hypothetical protein